MSHGEENVFPSLWAVKTASLHQVFFFFFGEDLKKKRDHLEAPSSFSTESDPSGASRPLSGVDLSPPDILRAQWAAGGLSARQKGSAAERVESQAS